MNRTGPSAARYVTLDDWVDVLPRTDLSGVFCGGTAYEAARISGCPWLGGLARLHRRHKRLSAYASLAFSKSLGLTIQRQKREAKPLRKRFSSWVGRLAAILRLKLETLAAISTSFDATRRN